jgi:hypothetical protein
MPADKGSQREEVRLLGHVSNNTTEILLINVSLLVAQEFPVL